MSGKRCAFMDCTNSKRKFPEISFFSFPRVRNEKSIKKRQEWINNAGLEQGESESFYDSQLVCQLHFQQKCFANYLCKRLVHDAVPTIKTADVTFPHNFAQELSAPDTTDSEMCCIDNGTNSYYETIYLKKEPDSRSSQSRTSSTENITIKQLNETTASIISDEMEGLNTHIEQRDQEYFAPITYCKKRSNPNATVTNKTIAPKQTLLINEISDANTLSSNAMSKKAHENKIKQYPKPVEFHSQVLDKTKYTNTKKLPITKSLNIYDDISAEKLVSRSLCIHPSRAKHNYSSKNMTFSKMSPNKGLTQGTMLKRQRNIINTTSEDSHIDNSNDESHSGNKESKLMGTIATLQNTISYYKRLNETKIKIIKQMQCQSEKKKSLQEYLKECKIPHQRKTMAMMQISQGDSAIWTEAEKELSLMIHTKFPVSCCYMRDIIGLRFPTDEMLNEWVEEISNKEFGITKTTQSCIYEWS